MKALPFHDFVSLSPKNMRIWFLLAFQAGAINAGGFIACHRFVTHTTGFATHFAFETVNAHYTEALGMLTVPFFFILGAMITAYFVDFRVTEGQKANYLAPTLLIFFVLFFAMLLGELGLFGVFTDPMVLKKDYALMVLLCLASGLQNALITNANGVVVRTTHLTGVSTDLALGLVRVFWGKNHKEKYEKESLANMARIGIIASFVLGSTISSYFFLRIQYIGFLVPFATSGFIFWHFYGRIKKAN